MSVTCTYLVKQEVVAIGPKVKSKDQSYNKEVSCMQRNNCLPKQVQPTVIDRCSALYRITRRSLSLTKLLDEYKSCLAYWAIYNDSSARLPSQYMRP